MSGKLHVVLFFLRRMALSSCARFVLLAASLHREHLQSDAFEGETSDRLESEIDVRRFRGGFLTMARLCRDGCAFFRHNYRYLQAWIQSARLGFRRPSSVLTQLLLSHICIEQYTHSHTPANNRVCGHWGHLGLRSSLGEHRGTS